MCAIFELQAIKNQALNFYMDDIPSASLFEVLLRGSPAILYSKFQW
ncbi:MAG: hypothetical protein LBR48_03290 [Dysgonamonadaceae bacterium]|nr:hypothetical protein [Dysgonamonadaceae bacterium]